MLWSKLVHYGLCCGLSSKQLSLQANDKEAFLHRFVAVEGTLKDAIAKQLAAEDSAERRMAAHSAQMDAIAQRTRVPSRTLTSLGLDKRGIERPHALLHPTCCDQTVSLSPDVPPHSQHAGTSADAPPNISVGRQKS